MAYEELGGIQARILIDKGEVMGEGFGVGWSPAVFAAEIDSGLIQEDVAEALRTEGINSEDDIRLIAKLGRWACSHRHSAGSCRRQKTGGCTLIRMVNSLAKGDELLAKNEDYHNCTT
ncbi:MAG TPA: hypothetical protein VMY43_10490 [Methanothrix sp.]|nr:hypothetical protein [Methanothrix sp.]